MANITAKQVNDLRTITGAGMMDCKQALTEANGDIEAAIDILRKKGQKVAAKREDRNAAEGSVFIHTNADQTEATIIALNCETDFVARNEEFVKLGNLILNAAVQGKYASIDELKSAVVDGRAVSEYITDLIGKIGEKIDVTKLASLKAEKVATYIHTGGKLGVVLGLNNTSGKDVVAAGKDVCMQIAALAPVAVDETGVDATVVEREKAIGVERARQEGKPENILEKIAMGYVSKFLKENTLLGQQYVKDPSLTVKQYLDGVSKGLTVSAFHRISVA